MEIKAVVFDIGGVLEIIDDSIFPGPWPARLGLTEAEFGSHLLPLAAEAAVGGLTESELNADWASTTPSSPSCVRTAGGGTSARWTGTCSTGSQRCDRTVGPGSCPTPARALASRNATTASRTSPTTSCTPTRSAS
ncbi:MAG: hypothetical protein ABIR39_07755 [Nocardioides sp.]|uniref:hypothetical protein n=1 Tax=Nocardioides sp. TaxID=35761 RepID=UPI0032630135